MTMECPDGTWYEEKPDGFVVGVINRTQEAMLAVPFAGMAFLFMLWGTLSWASVDDVPKLFLLAWCLFLLFVSVYFCKQLHMIVGKTEIRVSGNQGYLFRGIGRIGSKRGFSWNEGLTFEKRDKVRTGLYSYWLVISGSTLGEIKIGDNEVRRNFLVEVLNARHSLRFGSKEESRDELRGLLCPACNGTDFVSAADVSRTQITCSDCKHTLQLSDAKAIALFRESWPQPPRDTAWEERPDGFRISLKSPRARFGAVLGVASCAVFTILGGDIWMPGLFEAPERLLPYGFFLLVISLSLAWITWRFCARVEVFVEKDAGYMSEGIGRFARKRKFKWSEIRSIKEIQSGMRYSQYGYDRLAIQLDGSTEVVFGTTLSDDQRRFALAALKYRKSMERNSR